MNVLINIELDFRGQIRAFCKKEPVDKRRKKKRRKTARTVNCIFSTLGELVL
jgi:hypothetical protein